MNCSESIQERERFLTVCVCESLSLFVYLYFVVRVSHRAKREFEKEINKKESMVGLSLFVCEIDTKSSCNLSLSGGGKWGTWDVLFSFRNYGIGMHLLLSHGKVFSVGHTIPNSFFYIRFSTKKKTLIYIKHIL